MSQRSYQNLQSRTRKAGIPDDFFIEALVPDWFDEAASLDVNNLTHVEIAVARFMNTEVSRVASPDVPLALPEPFEVYVLKEVRDAAERALDKPPASKTDERLIFGWLEYCNKKLRRPEWFAQRYAYRVSWSDEKNCFIGTCAEFPGLFTSGETHKLALEAITSGILSRVTELYRTAKPIPQPKNPDPQSA